MAGVVADGAHKRQLAAPLQHVAQQHRAEADRAEDEPQPAERLERRQVRVLHLVERIEPRARRDGIDTVVGQPVLECGAHARRALGRGVDQEEPVAVVTGKQPLELALADQQLTLEHAVGERRHDAQVNGVAALAVEHEVVADRQVQRVRQRRGVGDGRHRAVLELAVEQQPGIGLLLRRLRGRGAEGEASLRDEGGGRRDHARVLRLVQVQAARVLARPDAEAVQRHAVQRLAGLEQVGDEQVLPPLRRGRVVDDRQQRVGQQRVAAGARAPVERIAAPLAAERVDGHDDERGRRDEGDGQHAAARPVGRVAESDPRQRPRLAVLPLRRGVQPGPGQHERRAQQQHAAAEEPLRGADQARRGHADQDRARAGQRAGNQPAARAPRGRGAGGIIGARGRHFGDRTGQQAARRRRRERAQRPGDRSQRRQHAADGAGAEHHGRDVERQPRGAHRVDPPGAQSPHDEPGVTDRPGHAQHAPGGRQHQPFGEEYAPHGAGGKSGRPQQAQLAQALLDAEAEEQAGQQQRRHDEEEAEVDEVQPEVGGAGRRLHGQRARRIDDEAERQRVELRPQRAGKLLPRRVEVLTRRRRNAYGSEPAPARLPELLAGGERHERLRRGSVVVPVVLVHRPDQAEIHVERRIPVDDVLRVGHPAVLRGEVAVVGRARDRHYVHHAQLGFTRDQAAFVLPEVVLQLQRVARTGVEVGRRPVVEHHRDRTAVRRGAAFRIGADHGQVEGRDQGVRRHPPAAADLVGEVCEHRLRGQAERRRRAAGGRFGLGVEQPGRRLHGKRAVSGDRTHPQANVVERRAGPDRRFDNRHVRRGIRFARARRPQQHRVDAALLLELRLEPVERHEHRTGQALLRAERELAQLRRRQHARYAQAQGASDVVAPAVKRAERHLGRPLDADEQRLFRRRAELARQALADERRVALQGVLLGIEAVEGPEPLVDTVHLHGRRAAAAGLVRDEAFDRNQRRGGLEGVRHPVVGQEVLRQRLADVAEARHHEVDRAQPLQRQRPQAGADRRADQQRPGQHRHGDGHAGHDGKVGAPVPEDVSPGERGQGHLTLGAPPRAGGQYTPTVVDDASALNGRTPLTPSQG